LPRKPEPNLKNSVRELRLGVPDLTQQALADRVSVTRQTIVAMEAGNYVPSLPLALRVARVFDKRVEDVFRLEDE
jgi:putative transcriptional regulator